MLVMLFGVMGEIIVEDSRKRGMERFGNNFHGLVSMYRINFSRSEGSS